MKRSTRAFLRGQGGLLGLAGVAIVLVVASLAWACTMQAHYLNITPNSGGAGSTPSVIPVAVAGYDALCGSAVCNVPAGTVGTGNLYRSTNEVAVLAWDLALGPNVYGNHSQVCADPAMRSTIGSGTVKWVVTKQWSTGSFGVVEVAGTGGMPNLSPASWVAGIYEVCADPNPAALYSYFTML